MQDAIKLPPIPLPISICQSHLGQQVQFYEDGDPETARLVAGQYTSAPRTIVSQLGIKKPKKRLPIRQLLQCQFARQKSLSDVRSASADDASSIRNEEKFVKHKRVVKQEDLPFPDINFSTILDESVENLKVDEIKKKRDKKYVYTDVIKRIAKNSITIRRLGDLLTQLITQSQLQVRKIEQIWELQKKAQNKLKV